VFYDTEISSARFFFITDYLQIAPRMNFLRTTADASRRPQYLARSRAPVIGNG
jgi:hypothetical protein